MMRVAYAFLCLAALAACNGGGQDRAAATGTAHFVNSPDNARSMALRDAYADFSFDYPAGWAQTPQPIDGTAENYVRVAPPMINGYEPYAFMVGHVSGSGNAARDRADLPRAANDLAGRFGATFRNYHIVSSGPGRIANYASYGWRFTATAPGVNGEPPVQIYGRGDLVLPPGATRGVTLISLATSRAGDVHSMAEVGERGPLKAILDSFRLANVQIAPAAPATRAPAAVNATSPIGDVPEPAPKQTTAPRARPATPPGATAPPAAHPQPAATVPHPAPAAQPAPERPKQETPSPAPPRPAPAGNGQ
ncbi:MAG: hypothetical protein JO276_02010 [Sphingomonadaceae bacterium]|nr:hypothetical protein [Sphingomonadaceae bacterium]